MKKRDYKELGRKLLESTKENLEIRDKMDDCECDCHLFVGGSGKPCPECIKEKCGQTKNKLKSLGES